MTVVATDLRAIYARQTGVNGIFGCEAHCRQAARQRHRLHTALAFLQTLHARSIRLAGPKGLVSLLLYRGATESVAMPTDVGALPDLQGYGKVRDLRQAMAMDATGELKAMVTAFTQATTPEDRDALVTQIIYRWVDITTGMAGPGGFAMAPLMDSFRPQQ